MENKILLQDLSVKLSQKKKLSAKDSDAFLKVFFETISEFVIKDKIVKVKGLGTFKLIDVLDRESVNVNTGERFVIPGHSKISFTPDAELKNKVNKPFELFQTVVINEGTSLEDMERMDKEEDVDAEDVDVVDSESVSPIEQEEENVGADSVMTSNLMSSAVTPSAPIEEELPEKEVGKSDETETNTDSLSVTSIIKDKESVSSTASSTESDQLSKSSTAKEPADNTKEKSAGPESKEKTEEVPLTIIKEVVVEGPVRLASCCRLCFMTVLLVMMCLSYIAGKYDVLSPVTNGISQYFKEFSIKSPSSDDAASSQTDGEVSNAGNVKETPSTDKKDAPAVKKETPKENVMEMASKYDQLEEGQYLIVGTKSVRTMKRGDNLYKMAKEELGDKELMRYIVVHNKFKNPDNVHLDTEVKIPDLRLKEE